MWMLGVDTSEPIGSVALYDGCDFAEERRMDRPLLHAERLFPLIDEILSANGLAADRIGAVAVNRGPGSFTGLRIGLAAAKGFCQAVGAALVGVSGAEAYRARIPDEKRVCVIVASRRDLQYVQFFGGSRPRASMQLMRRSELLERLHSEERHIMLVGSGAPHVAEALHGHPKIAVAPAEANRSSALSIAKIGWNETPIDRLYEVEPLYVEPLLA